MKLTPLQISSLQNDLLTSVEEIRRLRAVNDELAPQAEAFRTIKKLIDLLAPPASQGMSEDVAWRLLKVIDFLKQGAPDAEPAEDQQP